MRSNLRRPAQATGTALVETLVALPLLLLVTLGAVQWGLIFHAKSNLEYAALMAARAGSVSHADAEAIRKGLARGLLPLYSPPANAAGTVRTMTTRVLPDVSAHTRIRILNPTVEAFSDFAESNEDGINEIPNLDLHRRSTAKGASSGINIQDANLLKVEVLYGYELQVPLVGPLIAHLAQWWIKDARSRTMLANRRLPILASALVRMQSAARKNNLMVARADLSSDNGAAGATGDGATGGGGTEVGAGESQQGEADKAPGGGWSPVVPVSMTDPYHVSPRPSGRAGDEPTEPGSVPPIVDDPGAGNFDVCAPTNDVAAVTPTQPGQQVGNPINVVTGNKYQREVDLRPLPGELGLRFIRHYNSRVHRPSPIGYGWSYSYHVFIEPDGVHAARLHQADGRSIRFRRSSPPEGVHDTPPIQKVSYPSTTNGGRTDDRLTALRVEDGYLTQLAHGGYRWHWPTGRVLSFDHHGRLQSIRDRTGATVHLTRDPDGRLVKIQDPQKRIFLLHYDVYGRLVRTTDPGGLHTDYEYDRANNLIAVHYADGAQRKYHYEDSNDRHNLTGITDGRGIRFATYAYDGQDRAILLTHVNNVGRVSLQYVDRRTLVTDSLGRASIYYTKLDNNVPLVSRVDGPGCSRCDTAGAVYRYNARYQIQEIRSDKAGHIYFRYDSLGRLIHLVHSYGNDDGTTLTLRYYGDSRRIAELRQPSVHPKAHRLLRVRYDDGGNVARIAESGYAPDSSGQYRRVERAVKIQHDAKGRAVIIDERRDDVDDRVHVTWNGNGRLKKVLFPDATYYEVLRYDRYGRVASMRTDRSGVIFIQYDARGQLANFKTEKGSIDLGSDAAGYLRQVVFPGARYVEYRYDDAGRPVRKWGDHRWLEGEWSTINALTSIRLGYGEDTIAIWNLRKRARYRGSERRKYPTPKKPSSGARVAERRDREGRSTQYYYDDFGDLAYIQSPDTGVTHYRSDGNGTLVRKQDANGNVVDFEYGAGGQPTGINNGDSRTRIQLGRNRFTIFDGTASELVEFHDDHSVVRSRSRGGRRYTDTYRYDRERRLRTHLLPGGQSLQYVYDQDTGHLTAVCVSDGTSLTPLMTLKRDAADSTLRIRHGNGLVDTYKYQGQKLAKLQFGSDSARTYQYDPRGRLVRITRGGTVHKYYRYDQHERLDFALTPWALYGYRYDQNGNRVLKVVNGHQESYSRSGIGNRLDQVSSDGFSKVLASAADGSLVKAGDIEMVYGKNGQPHAVYRKGALLAAYRYNFRSERIAKTVYKDGAKHTTQFLYDRGRVSAELDAAGRILRQYVYLGRKPVAVLIKHRIFSIHTNHLNAPVAVTDEFRRVVWRADYAPFGRAFVQRDPDGDGVSFVLNLRNPGQYADQETGLYYNYYRYYDPDAGRYISADPLGLNAGLNPYTYAGNDPVQHVDPLGLLLFAFDGTNNTDDLEELRKDHTTITNVVRFREAYRADPGEPATADGTPYFYVTGAGKDDPGFGSSSAVDAWLGLTIEDRAYYMADRLVGYIERLKKLEIAGRQINLDIVGFSRGAASARDFANMISDLIDAAQSEPRDPEKNAPNRLAELARGITKQAHQQVLYFLEGGMVLPRRTVAQRLSPQSYLQRIQTSLDYLRASCVHLNLRFLGLFDTVPHYGRDATNDLQELRLAIPDSVDYAVHAIAINEHRKDFPAVSIHQAPGSPNTNNRVEAGFLGAHADIGGGYGEGDLSNVAFMWVVKHAAEAWGQNADFAFIRMKNWNLSAILFSMIASEFIPFRPITTMARIAKSYIWMARPRIKRLNGPGREWARRRQTNFHDQQFMTTGLCAGGRRRCALKGFDLAGDQTKVGAIYGTYTGWLRAHYKYGRFDRYSRN